MRKSKATPALVFRSAGWGVQLSLAALSLTAILTTAVGAAEEQRNATYNLDIPAQKLNDALQALAFASQHKLLYSSKLIDGKDSPGLKGKFTTEEAVKRLLTGTDLVYQITPDGLVVIRDRNSSNSLSTNERETKGERSLRLAQTNLSSPATDSESQNSSTKLDEIVVTARKRTERLQDVPASIAVVSSEDINRRGLLNSEDYLRGIPGVSQGRDHSGQSIVIRGIESSPSYQNWYSGTTVATYFGETPTTNSAGLSGGTNIDLKLIDIERVEVLRGPQGTAIGSSSLGGAVRTIPVAPQLDRPSGRVAASYSATSRFGDDNYMAQGIFNLPLVPDRLAVRGVAYQFEDSGFYRNRAGSDPGFRALIVTPFGAEDYARDHNDVGAYSVTGGRLAALFQATDDLKFALSYLKQKSEGNGYAAANSGTYEQTILEVADENARRGQRGGFSDTDIAIANAVMEYNLDSASVVATYSFLKGGSVSASNFSAFLPWALSERGTSEQREHVGELRVVTQLEGPLNGLAGIYIEKLDDTYSDIDYWTGDPATNFFEPGAYYTGGILEDSRILKQKAAFTEVSWEFLPRLTLTGGARAYKYDRTGHVVTEGLFGDGVTDVATDASGTSFRGNLNYKLREGALFYGGWSQGFRLGKPQAGLPLGLCDVDSDGIVDGTTAVTIESTRTVNSDEVDSYEIGGKFVLLGRRLTIDAAAFRMNWEGMPVAVVTASPPEGCGLGYTTNAGAARSEGVEFQANVQFNEALRADFGASYVNARLTEDVPTAGFVSGSRLPGSPKLNANIGLQKEFEIAGHEAFVRADALYVGSIYGSILQQIDTTRAGDYVKLDASARMSFGNLDVDLFIRNLTNEDAFAFRAGSDLGEFFGYRLRPRTVGLQLGYTFGL